MNVFFTADSHYSHSNIIKYCNRPYVSVSDMNASFIQKWNNKVKQDDVVYHLGDFLFGKDNYSFDSIFYRLNGKIILIEGNHDELAFKNKDKFAEYHKGYHEINIKGQRIVLSHYPIICWNKKKRGAIMLHGHCHYNLPITRKESNHIGKILDVGVDGNNYEPYSFDDIVQIMKNKPIQPESSVFRDHHDVNSVDSM